MIKIILNAWYTLKVAVVLAYISINIQMILRFITGQSRKEASRIYIHLRDKEYAKDKEREKPKKIAASANKKNKLKRKTKPEKIKAAHPLKKRYIIYARLIRHLKNCIKLKCASAKMKYTGIGTEILAIIGIAWICEKLDINLKIISPKAFPCFFGNSVLICSGPYKRENFDQLKEPITHIEQVENTGFRFVDVMAGFASHRVSSEYGHKIISKLSINQNLQQQADEWYRANIKGDCIGVHYRGTDVIYEGRRIKIDAYIAYLKKILKEDSYIFACSDQAQFIDQIKIAFPNRVAAREITRSYDHEPIHFNHDPQQKQDAFIDLLILAKTKLICTIGGCFIDCTRFLNPSIKIIALEDRHRNKINSKRIPNYLPMPEEDFAKEIKQQAKKWEAPYF